MDWKKREQHLAEVISTLARWLIASCFAFYMFGDVTILYAEQIQFYTITDVTCKQLKCDMMYDCYACDVQKTLHNGTITTESILSDDVSIPRIGSGDYGCELKSGKLVSCSLGQFLFPLALVVIPLVMMLSYVGIWLYEKRKHHVARIMVAEIVEAKPV